MLNKLTFALTLALSSLALAIVPKAGMAQTALSQATVESLQNQVRLYPTQQNPRSARVSDVLRLGDTIATANSSRVDLRFNDRSLARLGAQAVFRFRPGTRTADLQNGTGLFLINPGQGTTTIRTPNAAAGIRGSALFVRVIPTDDNETMTLIGALTDSGIQSCNQDASQCVELEAGQMASFEGEDLTGVYQFDVETFLSTSPLAQGIDQVAPDLVLGELQEAIDTVPELTGTVVNTPEFVQMPDNSEAEFPEIETAIVDYSFDSGLPDDVLNANALNPQEMTEIGEIILNTPNSEFPGGGATGGIFPGGGATGGIFPGDNNGNNNGNNGVRDLGAGQGRDGVGQGTGTGLENRTTP